MSFSCTTSSTFSSSIVPALAPLHKSSTLPLPFSLHLHSLPSSLSIRPRPPSTLPFSSFLSNFYSFLLHALAPHLSCLLSASLLILRATTSSLYRPTAHYNHLQKQTSGKAPIRAHNLLPTGRVIKVNAPPPVPPLQACVSRGEEFSV